MELDKKSMTPVFSVILPLYKQEHQIEVLFDRYVSALSKMDDSWELLFIINGNKDNSFASAQELALKNTSVKVFNLESGGWGRAVKFGIAKASGNFICYTNSARTNTEDLMLMLKYAKVNDRAVVKATRIIRETFLRKLGSVLYNFENRFLFKTPIWDVNGTPKIISRKVLQSIEIISDDDLIDAEIIARCFKKNIPIIEIPVTSTKRISGRSTTNFKSAFRMYMGLLKLKKKI